MSPISIAKTNSNARVLSYRHDDCPEVLHKSHSSQRDASLGKLTFWREVVRQRKKMIPTGRSGPIFLKG
jgi:hypothetical protein